MSTWRHIKRAAWRETLLLRTQRQYWVLPICFAITMLTLLQFALDEPELLRTVLPRFYSIIALLVMFLIPEYLFKMDWLSGYLHQYALSPMGFSGAVSVRLFIQALWMGVPLFIVLLLSIYTVDLSPNVCIALVVSIALLLPILFLLSAFSSALTLTLPQSSLLGILILMPFYCPPLIIAQSMVLHAQMDVSFSAEIYLLCAMAMLACAGLPWLMIILLRRALG